MNIELVFYLHSILKTITETFFCTNQNVCIKKAINYIRNETYKQYANLRTLPLFQNFSEVLNLVTLLNKINVAMNSSIFINFCWNKYKYILLYRKRCCLSFYQRLYINCLIYSFVSNINTEQTTTTHFFMDTNFKIIFLILQIFVVRCYRLQSKHITNILWVLLFIIWQYSLIKKITTIHGAYNYKLPI